VLKANYKLNIKELFAFHSSATHLKFRIVVFILRVSTSLRLVSVKSKFRIVSVFVVSNGRGKDKGKVVPVLN
jgi:hypothetical protein